jgi:hypothetical protein
VCSQKVTQKNQVERVDKVATHENYSLDKGEHSLSADHVGHDLKTTERGTHLVTVRFKAGLSKKRQAELIINALDFYGLDVRTIDFSEELDS